MIYRLRMNRLEVHINAPDYPSLLKGIRDRYPATCAGNLYVVWTDGKVHWQSDKLQSTGDVCTDAGVVGEVKKDEVFNYRRLDTGDDNDKLRLLPPAAE